MTTQRPQPRVTDRALQPPQQEGARKPAEELHQAIKAIYNFTDEDLAVAPWRLRNFESKVDTFLRSDAWTGKRDKAMRFSGLGPEKAAEIDATAADLLHAYRRALKVRTKVMDRHPGKIAPEYDMRHYGNGWNKYHLSNAYLAHHAVDGLDAFMQCGLSERSALSVLGAASQYAVDLYSRVQPHVHIATAAFSQKQHIPPLQDPYIPWEQRVQAIRNHPHTLMAKLNEAKPREMSL